MPSVEWDKDIAEVYGHGSDLAVVSGAGIRKGSRYLVRVTKDGDALVPTAHDRLQPQSVLVRRSTLEDVFLRLTGRTLID